MTDYDPATPIHERTATRLAAELDARTVTSVEVTSHLLDRVARENDELRAFVTVTADAALERAAEADRELERRRELSTDERATRRRARPILGLPIGDKDLSDRAGVPTSYGSRSMSGYVPKTSARIVTDLDAAGGVSLGKTNTPEFGFPSYCENRIGAPARNPWDRARGPGGSSGGAAVAVAAAQLPFAPGSDGGGSIRIPAAACGLVGLKPSRGRVPGGSGVDALAGLSVAGPIARTAADAALLLDAMLVTADDWSHALWTASDRDGRPASFADDLGSRVFGDEPDARAGLERLRVGVSTWSPWAGHTPLEVDGSHLAVLERVVGALEVAGHEIVRIPGGLADGGSEVGATIAGQEGVVDGEGFADAFRAVWRGGAAALPLDDAALAHVEPLTAWLVRSGRDLPVAELSRGLAYLADFEQRVIRAYRGFDVVLTPALAMSPRPIGWYDDEDGEHSFDQQVRYTPFTAYVNAAGLPAIAMPVAAEPLPVGVQAIGRRGREDVLLRLAAWLEPRFGWAARRPAAPDDAR